MTRIGKDSVYASAFRIDEAVEVLRVALRWLQ